MADVAVRFGAVDDGKDGKEPAMGLYNPRQSTRNMYAIPLSAAHKYTDQGYLLRASFAIAQYLNMFPDQFLVNRIADTIVNNLETLVKHKPVGLDDKGEAFAEGEIRVNGERIEQFEAWTNGDVVK